MPDESIWAGWLTRPETGEELDVIAGFRNWREYVDGFYVNVELANHQDLTLSRAGYLAPDQVHRTVISGMVDTGATRLVLPRSVVTALARESVGQITIKFPDGRRELRPIVGGVRLEYAGRSGVFSAVVEPGLTDALIGTMVLEELDLLPDCAGKALVPRDPDGIISEVE